MNKPLGSCQYSVYFQFNFYLIYSTTCLDVYRFLLYFTMNHFMPYIDPFHRILGESRSLFFLLFLLLLCFFKRLPQYLVIFPILNLLSYHFSLPHNKTFLCYFRFRWCSLKEHLLIETHLTGVGTML